MEERRRGNQDPTNSLYLPYEESKAEEAITIYEKTGRSAQEWQKKLLTPIMGLTEGLWSHSRFGYQVSRRNGKSEVVLMRELWALTHGERVLHTAHRTATSHAAWELLGHLLTLAGYKEGTDYKTYKQLGFESIIMAGEGVVNYRTRSSKAGLGEGYDLLIIDEAQEYTVDQASALKYVISASRNPQTIFCGTPPTVSSAGTVFADLRKKALNGETESTGWAEWSIDELTNPNDIEAWYLTNPALGTLLTERAIRDEIDGDEVDFNVQRLGLWLRYNQKSAISKLTWEGLAVDTVPELSGKLFVGVKYGKDGQNVALSIAVRTWDGAIFVETVDCLPILEGNAWILGFLREADYEKVIIDGASGTQNLEAEMKDFGLKKPTMLTAREYINANFSFTQAVEDGAIEHRNQPSLAQVVTNCERRAIGSSGGFGYRSISVDNDIVLMDSVILAYYGCASHVQTKTKQRATY